MFFFFQAEDGIRDLTVTGVQTCALPIYLALACPRCNAQKWTYTDALDPTTGQRVPLFNPRAQEWAEHFRWSAADSAILEPLSASGRATLALLDMNSPHHVLIRRWLQAIGKHPAK